MTSLSLDCINRVPLILLDLLAEVPDHQPSYLWRASVLGSQEGRLFSIPPLTVKWSWVGECPDGSANPPKSIKSNQLALNP